MSILIFTKIFRCSGSSCIISQALAQDWRKVLEILEKLRKLFPWTSILEKIGILSSRPSGVVIEGSSVLYHLLIWLVLILNIIFNFQFVQNIWIWPLPRSCCTSLWSCFRRDRGAGWYKLRSIFKIMRASMKWTSRL